MTKHEILAALRAAMEPSRELDTEIWLTFTPGATRKKITVTSTKNLWPPYEIDETRDADGFFVIVPHYTSSLDAAVALCERMLPRWELALAGPWRYAEGHERAGQEVWHAEVCHCFEESGLGYAQVNDIEHRGATHAIALCAAVIAALIAQEERND